jgi:TetR/AcrR family transcriptional regulator
MATEALAVRWGDGRRADSDYAREQILDAAWHCYQQNGIFKTSMEHIAREAKVSRTTIYRYFENRDEVLTGVVVKATDALTQELREHVRSTDTFAEFLTETLVSVTELVPRSQVFQLMLGEPSAVLSRLCIGSADLQVLAENFFRDRFNLAKERGELCDGIELPQLTAWLLHVISSYVLANPLRNSGPEWRQTVRQFLLPAIVRM